MAKDNANIYKLSDEDFKKEKANLWANSIVGAENIARMLKEEILHEETPFVLSVNASYGMGKTYFFSRFCEYLRDNNIPSVYISAWENDYVPSPYLYLFGEIFKYLASEMPIVSSMKKLRKNAVVLGKRLLSNVSISCGVEFNLGGFVSSFFKEKDDIKEFKVNFVKMLKELQTKQKNNYPLVIIIDELDRCRPDYALKTIEIMKHFFDIENLVFILPINEDAIKNAVKAVYGDLNKSNEVYLKKLIDKEISLLQPQKESYVKLVQLLITKKKIASAIDKGFISADGYFNGFNRIAEVLGTNAFKLNLTCRETAKLCDTFVLIANNVDRKLDIDYVCCNLCSNLGKGSVNLSNEHPYNGISDIKCGKGKILYIFRLSNLSLNFRIPDTWLGDFTELYRDSDIFLSYSEFYEYVETVKKIDKDGRSTPRGFSELKSIIYPAEDEAMAYQEKYGSSDADEENKVYFDKIVKSNMMLFE